MLDENKSYEITELTISKDSYGEDKIIKEREWTAKTEEEVNKMIDTISEADALWRVEGYEVEFITVFHYI